MLDTKKSNPINVLSDALLAAEELYLGLEHLASLYADIAAARATHNESERRLSATFSAFAARAKTLVDVLENESN